MLADELQLELGFDPLGDTHGDTKLAAPVLSLLRDRAVDVVRERVAAALLHDGEPLGRASLSLHGGLADLLS